MRIRPFDGLAAIGLPLFLLLTWLLGYDRFVRYCGLGNLTEFYVYAVVIFVCLCLFWLFFRRYDWHLSTVLLIAGGIFLHCVGSIPIHDGVRVYDLGFYGIRFDKGVHFINAFIAARVVISVFHFERVPLGRLEGPATVLIVLGVGTCWEIAEYIVVLTIPGNGVGLYVNNMGDLVANLLGSVCSRLLLRTSWRSVDEPVPGRGAEA